MATFSDNFNRPDNLVLGAPWSDNSGDFQVVSNQAKAIGVSSSYENTSMGGADYSVSVDMIYNKNSGQPGYGWWVEPYIRASGATLFDNCYFLYVQNYTDGTVGVSLYKRVAGVQTLLTSGNEVRYPLTDGTTHTYTIEAQGTTIRSFIDGNLFHEVTDSSISIEGLHGMRANDQVSVDNYIVSSDNLYTRTGRDGQYAIAIEYARIYVSTDYGKTFTQDLTAPNNKTWASIDISHDGRVIVAVQQSGRAYKRVDGTWFEIQPVGNSDQNWARIKVSGDGTHILCGNNGYLFLSHNQGSTWSSYWIGNFGVVRLLEINRDGSKFFWGVEGQRLWYSPTGAMTGFVEIRPAGDANKSWVESWSTPDFSHVVFIENRLWHTDNLGTSFTEISPSGDFADHYWNTFSSNGDMTRMIAGGQYSTYAWMYRFGRWEHIFPGGLNDYPWSASSVSFDGLSRGIANSHLTEGEVFTYPGEYWVNTGPVIHTYWYGLKFNIDDNQYIEEKGVDVTAKARILKYGETQTEYSKARIKYTGVNRTVTAKAKIQNFVAAGYDHFLTITVDHHKVFDTDQTNFPVLVQGTWPFLKSTANGGHVESDFGYDIIFTTTDGFYKLSHEMIKYEPTTGQYNFWVKIPTLSTSVDTQFRMYYGNASIVAPTEDKPGTWDANFKGVYHLQEASGNAIDSTSNANTMTASGPILYQQPGQLGANSVRFNGSSTIFYRPTVFTVAPTEATESVWVQYLTYNSLNSTIHHGYLLSMGVMGNNGVPQFVDGQVLTPAGWKQVNVNTTTSTWYKFTVTAKQNEKVHLYLNGVEVGTGTAITTFTNPGANYYASIGAYKEVVLGQLYYSNAYIQEARYANVQRSAGWIKTEYYNETDPTFLDYTGEHISINVTVTARAKIKNTSTQTADAKARIKYTGITKTVTARASIIFGGIHIFGDEGLIY